MDKPKGKLWLRRALMGILLLILIFATAPPAL